MAFQLLTLIAPFIIAIALFEIVPIKSSFNRLQKLNKKVMTIIFVSQLPKNKKKQLLQLLLLKIIKSIFFLYAYLLIISLPFVGFIILEDKFNLSISFLKFYSQTSGIITTSAIVLIYILVKKAILPLFHKD